MAYNGCKLYRYGQQVASNTPGGFTFYLKHFNVGKRASDVFTRHAYFLKSDSKNSLLTYLTTAFINSQPIKKFIIRYSQDIFNCNKFPHSYIVFILLNFLIYIIRNIYSQKLQLYNHIRL